MSTLRHFVVVSVSAAMCAGGQPLANASSSAPSFSPSNESAELSQRISAQIQTQDNFPKSNPKTDTTVSRTVAQSVENPEENAFAADRTITHLSALENRQPSSEPRKTATVTGESQNALKPTQVNREAVRKPPMRSNSSPANPLPDDNLRNNSKGTKAPRQASGQNSSASSVAQRVRPVPFQVPPVPLPNRVPPTPVPPNLEPNPNPLQFPTRPEEVNIEVTQPLTLEQAIELARRNNRNLQVARLQLQQAQAQLREARAALYPSLDFQGSAAGGRTAQRERQLEQQIPESSGLEIDEESAFSISGSLQVTYNLLTGGRRGAQIRAAEEGVRNAQLQVEALNEQTGLDVTNAYYDLQLADEQVRIAESAVRNAQQSLRDAQALEQAGLGTRFDTLRAQVQLANQNQLLVTNRAQQQVNRRQLAQLLSVPQSINVVAADPVEVAGLWNLSLEESIVRAFQNRAELQQQLTQRNIAEQQRQIALSAQRPQLSLFANYEVEDIFNDGLGLADGYQVGARVQLNLFDGGAARAQAAQQEANIAIAETQFADRRNQIRFQVEQGFFNLQANFLNIQTANLAVTQAAEALRLARLRFQAGVGTQTEVIEAENDLIEAQGNQVRAVIDYNRSLATLIRAVSNLPPGNVRIAQ